MPKLWVQFLGVSLGYRFGILKACGTGVLAPGYGSRGRHCPQKTTPFVRSEPVFTRPISPKPRHTLPQSLVLFPMHMLRVPPVLPLSRPFLCSVATSAVAFPFVSTALKIGNSTTAWLLCEQRTGGGIRSWGHILGRSAAAPICYKMAACLPMGVVVTTGEGAQVCC